VLLLIPSFDSGNELSGGVPCRIVWTGWAGNSNEDAMHFGLVDSMISMSHTFSRHFEVSPNFFDDIDERIDSTFTLDEGDDDLDNASKLADIVIGYLRHKYSQCVFTSCPYGRQNFLFE
jgi:hypothetical protein